MTILDDLWVAAVANAVDATPVDEDVPDMYELGKIDCAAGGFKPPSCMSLEYDNYIRGWNDEWAKVNKRNLLR